MKKIYRILAIMFIIIMILSIISLLFWHFHNSRVKEIVREEKTHLKLEEETYQLEETILEDNSNTIGWLMVPGTRIDYPVLQYTDNSYYLNHDFHHHYNTAGWIFMDYRNKLDDQNIVIYGHHRRDGSMFGSMDLLFNKLF